MSQGPQTQQGEGSPRGWGKLRHGGGGRDVLASPARAGVPSIPASRRAGSGRTDARGGGAVSVPPPAAARPLPAPGMHRGASALYIAVKIAGQDRRQPHALPAPAPRPEVSVCPPPPPRGPAATARPRGGGGVTAAPAFAGVMGGPVPAAAARPAPVPSRWGAGSTGNGGCWAGGGSSQEFRGYRCWGTCAGAGTIAGDAGGLAWGTGAIAWGAGGLEGMLGGLHGVLGALLGILGGLQGMLVELAGDTGGICMGSQGVLQEIVGGLQGCWSHYIIYIAIYYIAIYYIYYMGCWGACRGAEAIACVLGGLHGMLGPLLGILGRLARDAGGLAGVLEPLHGSWGGTAGDAGAMAVDAGGLQGVLEGLQGCWSSPGLGLGTWEWQELDANGTGGAGDAVVGAGGGVRLVGAPWSVSCDGIFWEVPGHTARPHLALGPRLSTPLPISSGPATSTSPCAHGPSAALDQSPSPHRGRCQQSWGTPHNQGPQGSCTHPDPVGATPRAPSPQRRWDVTRCWFQPGHT